MKFDWIDGSVLLNDDVLVWAEIESVLPNRKYYATCYYDDGIWREMHVGLLYNSKVLRYFVLPVELEIKPCPCCGRAGILYPLSKREGEEQLYYIQCENCYLTTDHRNKEGAIKTWNRRV